MKTTLEIPDAVFRRAKVQAAQENLALREFVTRAVEEKLAASQARQQRRRELFGALRQWRRETEKIDRLIADTFETVESEDGSETGPENEP